MDQLVSNSIYTKAYSPYIQAAIIFGAGLVVNVAAKIINLTGLLTVSGNFHWKTAASFLLLFAVLNSVFSLSSKNTMQYWGKSIYSYMGLGFASCMIAYLLSSMTIGEAGFYRWIFLVVTIVYLVFLSMVTFMRKIVQFAEREEWNQPRRRR